MHLNASAGNFLLLEGRMRPFWIDAPRRSLQENIQKLLKCCQLFPHSSFFIIIP